MRRGVRAGFARLQGVLSLWKLAAGDGPERYYLEQVAQGRDDYYAGEGEEPGQWAGAETGGLGLVGLVDDEGFTRLLQSRDPSSGGELRRPMREGAVAGYDLTFRAPKSVSIVWGTCDDTVRREIREAHDHAATQAVGYLEREACWARRGRNGVEQVRGGGFVAAAFRHRSSRAGDPLLHTHVVVGNLTQGPDGRWTALDGRHLYRHAKTAGFLYQAELRVELTRRLGLEFGPVREGSADLAGVSREVVEHFSQRRAEIVEHMAEHGGRSTRSAQVAALETRRAKRALPVDRMRERWRARAAEQGLGWVERERLLADGGAGPRAEAPVGPAELLDELTHENSTFGRRDVLQALASSWRAGASVRSVEARADELLATSAVVRLADSQVAGGAEPRYTTPEMLDIERRLLDGADRRRGQGAARAESEHIARVLAERPELSAEQAAMVRALAGSGDGVQVVRAAAGTGKTFALEAARHAWEASDCRVLGCALSARAAAELEAQAGIDATTSARLTGELARGHNLRADDVLVVDEAGMVGTRTLAWLADHAEETGAKLVLVGDERQLPELQAGGAFRALGDRLGAVELREVRRQRHEWDRDALAALREGDVDTWADAYTDHGRIVARSTARGVRAQLVSDWWRASRDPECDAVMIAHRRSDVAELNQHARSLTQASGQIGPDELEVGDRAFAVGDRVVAERNDRCLGIVNGQRGVVAAVDLDRRTAQLRLPGGASVELDAGYLDAGHLNHGYALTAHKAQGATVDRAFVLGSDDLYREWGYTALSRHREEARFYLVSPGSAERAVAETDRDPLLERLHDLFGTSRAKTLALDELPAAERRAELEQLAAEHDELHDAEQRAARRQRGAQQERDAAEHQLERLREERGQAGLFDRSERQRIRWFTANATSNREHSAQLAEQHADELADASQIRHRWLDDNADRASALLHAEHASRADGRDELRDELAGRLGETPGLLNRDALAETVAHELISPPEPTIAPEVPPIDIGPDLGP